MFSSQNSQVSSDANYIEDVFSTWLYTGTGASQTQTNNIDLAGKGGLVWLKKRSAAESNYLQDSSSSFANSLVSNTTAAALVGSGIITSVSSTGFTTSSVSSGTTYASWTFRKQPKFFDVVTYTGNGVAGRTIAHSLGSTPGMMIVKNLSIASNWRVYHQSLGATKYMYLNTTSAAFTGTSAWNDTAPTSTVFTVGNDSDVNNSGDQFVAYLFAHNAGGFGLTGTDNVISCGSFTMDGSGNPASVTLGYEPQMVIVKRTDSTSNWYMEDNMRGLPVTGNGAQLYANTSGAEAAQNIAYPNATGFTWNIGIPSATYIYIAIRRGPMKVPTSGTSVFSPTTYTGNGATGQTITSVGFPLDFVFDFKRSALDNKPTLSRLTANNALYTNLSDAQNPLSTTAFTFDVMNGFKLGNSGDTNGNGTTYIAECFRRAPSFFDAVCYNGQTGSSQIINHNLRVAPELVIIKKRETSTYFGWPVYLSVVGANNLYLNDTSAAGTYLSDAVSSPTSTTFTVSNNSDVNGVGSTFVAYLFATCTGVSKVGSYTGTGTTKQVDCGFAAGARFVLIKRTDSTGDWYVWDSARGIVSGNDPYLLLNTTGVEVTNTDYVDTYSAGFEISSTAPAAINASGGTFIFLAIA